MNNIWSEHVQGVMTLYLSRQLRFDDRFASQYKSSFRLDADAPLKILEIGCGPGALAEALRRWYPKAEITGIDRDSNFIAFAKQTVKGAVFLEGDATRLPFADDTFDVTVSNTVQEHVEPGRFWGEQLRVLKPGGVCLCLSARKGLRCVAPCLAPTAEENAFWAKAPAAAQSLEQHQVCGYPLSEAALPASMEKSGFHNVETGYALIDLTPDAPKYPPAMAKRMIEADRHCDLEAIRSMHADGEEKAIAAVNAKYDERLRLYDAGLRQWDAEVCVTMILRGNKRTRPVRRKRRTAREGGTRG